MHGRVNLYLSYKVKAHRLKSADRVKYKECVHQ